MKGFFKARYHWVIAAIVLLEMFIYVGILNNINGLYIIPVSDTLGISRGDYSLAFSARALVGAVSVVVSAPALRRFGYRKMGCFFLLVAAGAFAVLSASQNLFMLYLGTTLIGICEGTCLTSGATYIIGRWFHKYRGSVLGFVTAATGIGGSAVCILLTGIIQTSGWRLSLLVCAGMTGAVALLIGLLIRDEPGHIGLKPFGEGEGQMGAKGQKDNWHGFPMERLVRMPGFYLAVLEVFLSCLALYIVFYAVVPYLQSRGFTSEEAASIQSIMLLAMAAFKLLTGVLSDWIGAKSTVGLCLGASVLSLYLLIRAETMPAATVAVIVYSLGLPLTTVTVPLLSASLFGYSTHNRTSGIFFAMPALGAMIASPLASGVFDRVGSYLPAFNGALLLSAAVFVLHLCVCCLANRERKNLESTREEKV